ncbi:M48 family metallopeptidase [Aestuariicella hydrocarbonica]|uniref:M48 family metallopeptidase n=1 Tax=Pseudomaricurvus hydrocarbonicus TaxID=1470433 RepID=A0A9E5JU20_9GAMM|nr:SprT family zinc-dependent metalloprotease [Aestuariicella hydrocarbonica]NHO64511.1 M48 family metallopeptidase [Aestuariicella hydrocarbonica]
MPLFLKKRQNLTPPQPKARMIAVDDPGHLGFDYTIRLSRRQSAAIEIRHGKVLVAAPHRTAQRDLKLWVEQKAHWIRSKLKQQAQRQAQIPTPQFSEGETWPWLGHPMTLSIRQGKQLGAQHHGQSLFISLSPRSRKPAADQIKTALQSWYQQQALTLLETKTQSTCARLQQLGYSVQHTRTQLRRTKSKWGHCTRQGVIQYNWLIAQAPEWVVDYLVVHECCHLVHHNHSRTYWNLVATLYPDYALARQWLNQHGHTLTL